MLTAYCDGACRGGNPGFTSAAFVVYDGDAEKFLGKYYLGPERHTNNHAEFMALLYLLHALDHYGMKRVSIYSDSKLVVNTVTQQWLTNAEDLKTPVFKAYAMLVRGNHTLEHCKGHDANKGNERADTLANECLDDAGIPLA
jgi:ribonuclease HI